MRFEPDPEAASWLECFGAAPEDFEWDEGNREKNLKHGVSGEEVESIFRQQAYLFAGKIVEPAHAEWRGLILGETDDGRAFTLIFTRRGDRLRPISCGPMRKDERRFYETSVEAKSH